MSRRLPSDRDRDTSGRARNARARDQLGRPLARSDDGTAPADDPALPAAAALRRGQQLLDDGQPFTAHEVFEAVWKDTAGADREVWRGLAQLAVGITHALRGNDSGARALLQRAADTLSDFRGTTPRGLDIDGVGAWARLASNDLSLTSQPPRLVDEA
jgi:uncharacterized protein